MIVEEFLVEARKIGIHNFRDYYRKYPEGKKVLRKVHINYKMRFRKYVESK